MRGPAAVKDEPPEEASLLETTPSSAGTAVGGFVVSHRTSGGEASYDMTFGALPKPEVAPPRNETHFQYQEASLSPASTSSTSENLDLPPSPPLLPPISETLLPELGCDSLNSGSVPPSSASALFAPETTKSIVPESVPHNLCPNTAEEGEIPSELETASPQLPSSALPPEDNSHPPPNQITNEPPLKKSRATPEEPQHGCENLNFVPARSRSWRRRQRLKLQNLDKTLHEASRGCQPDIHSNMGTEAEMETSQMDMDNGDEEVLEGTATEIAPSGSDTRDSETAASPETRNQVSVSETPAPPQTRTQVTASETPAPATRGTASETPAPPGTGTQGTASGCLRKMIPVSVYAGGEVKFNQTGAEYTIPPVVTFPSTERTSFNDMRSEIYKGLKLSENQISLNIQARYNAVSSGSFFFTLLAINDDKAWQMIYEMAVSGMNWHIIELYVKSVPNQTSRNVNPSQTTSSIPQRMPMHSTPSPTTSLDYPMQAYWSRPQQVPNPTSSPVTSRAAQKFMPMRANPSQTMPHKPLVQGSRSRPNSIPGSYPVMGTRIQHHNRNMHSEASQTKPNNSPLQGSCMRPPIPNHPNPSSASTSSMPLWNMPRHANSSQTMPHNAPVQGSHQNSIPGSGSWFSQGKSSSPPVLSPSAGGSFSMNRRFKSKADLVHALDVFCVREKIGLAITSSKSQLVVRCKNQMCQWKLHATPTGPGVHSNWVIKSCPCPHTCLAPALKLNHPELTVSKLACEIRKNIQQDAELKIIKIRELILKKFPGAQPSYKNLWHARERAIAEVFGSWEESYALLPRLFEAIKFSNPETRFDLQSDSMTQSGHQQFKRVAWTFGPCINAYRFLRPVISVKALLLLGKYDGRLLIACGCDADNQSVPLAFALVNEDTESNWIWFMKFLRQEVIGPGKLVCVISNFDGSIRNVFEQPSNGWCEVKREAVHRLCSQHAVARLSKVCKDSVVIDIFKSATLKKNPHNFERDRNASKCRSPEIHLYLEKLGKRRPQGRYEDSTHRWAQCKDKGYRYGIMASNCSETVKKVFKSCQRLPMAAIVESTFCNCMRWFSERKKCAAEQAAVGKVWSDTVTAILKKREDKAQKYVVRTEPQDFFCDEKKEYEVAVTRKKDNVLRFLKYTVTVVSRSTPDCECQKLKLTGIPCSHVIAVCHKRKVDANKFLNAYYRLQMLVNTWSSDFHLYGNRTEWPEYNRAVIVPDQTLMRMGPRKPENPKDQEKNSGKQTLSSINCGQVGQFTKKNGQMDSLTGNSSNCQRSS